jgi:hypothetical protein
MLVYLVEVSVVVNYFWTSIVHKYGSHCCVGLDLLNLIYNRILIMDTSSANSFSFLHAIPYYTNPEYNRKM